MEEVQTMPSLLAETRLLPNNADPFANALADTFANALADFFANALADSFANAFSNRAASGHHRRRASARWEPRRFCHLQWRGVVLLRSLLWWHTRATRAP